MASRFTQTSGPAFELKPGPKQSRHRCSIHHADHHQKYNSSARLMQIRIRIVHAHAHSQHSSPLIQVEPTPRTQLEGQAICGSSARRASNPQKRVVPSTASKQPAASSIQEANPASRPRIHVCKADNVPTGTHPTNPHTCMYVHVQ
jgi:hypothetical protein